MIERPLNRKSPFINAFLLKVFMKDKLLRQIQAKLYDRQARVTVDSVIVQTLM